MYSIIQSNRSTCTLSSLTMLAQDALHFSEEKSRSHVPLKPSQLQRQNHQYTRVQSRKPDSHTYIYIYIYIYISIYISILMSIYIKISFYFEKNICISKYRYIYTYVYLYLSLCISIYQNIYFYICLYIYI